MPGTDFFFEKSFCRLLTQLLANIKTVFQSETFEAKIKTVPLAKLKNIYS